VFNNRAAVKTGAVFGWVLLAWAVVVVAAMVFVVVVVMVVVVPIFLDKEISLLLLARSSPSELLIVMNLEKRNLEKRRKNSRFKFVSFGQ
jgi:hypothetical protein